MKCNYSTCELLTEHNRRKMAEEASVSDTMETMLVDVLLEEVNRLREKLDAIRQSQNESVSNSYIRPATYTSVWDDSIEITSRCMVNVTTRKILYIESVCTVDGLEVLNRAYVTLDNVQYPAYRADELEDCVLEDPSLVFFTYSD